MKKSFSVQNLPKGRSILFGADNLGYSLLGCSTKKKQKCTSLFWISQGQKWKRVRIRHYRNTIFRLKVTNTDVEKTNPCNNKQLLIKIFKTLKKEIKILKQPVSINYHDKFFNYALLILLSDCCCLNHHNSKLGYIRKFDGVSNLNEFKKYLKLSDGLYAKLILWIIQHPFPNNSMKKVQHHVMPKFLSRRDGQYELHGMKTILNKTQIEQNYNVIKISFIIHFVMHLVRLVEYQQLGDALALPMLLDSNPNVSKTIIITNHEKLVHKSLNNVFNNDFSRSWLPNYPKFKKAIEKTKKKLDASKPGRGRLKTNDNF